MKIYTLGTCAGTQPRPGEHHVSTAIETENGVYFIDVGECASYTGHLCGLNLLDTRAVFITHTHMDHVGGLGNLLWNIRKVSIVRKEKFHHDNIDIFTPCTETVDGFMMVLKNTEGDFQCDYTHTTHKYSEGVIFDNGDIKVTAIHTNHLIKDNEYLSYSFTVECEGKILVFSGDMWLDDIEHIVPDKCDAFFVETGHHKIDDIYEKIKSTGKDIGRMMFTHNNFLRHEGSFENAEKKIKRLFGEQSEACSDGSIYII